MARHRKTLQKILDVSAHATIRFERLRSLLAALRFDERVRGSHHIYSRSGIVEILNLQPRPDGTAKPYQVKQVRNVLLEYDLGSELE